MEFCPFDETWVNDLYCEITALDFDELIDSINSAVSVR